MTPPKDLLFLGEKLLLWYKHHGRDLPFRETKDPYKIWICEIIFQQTRISQGLEHYQNFLQKFPTLATLAAADLDEVLLAWKGLGYYSRAIYLHQAAKQIMTSFGGVFPQDLQEILSLKGIGKYTAAAISSISFGKDIPAIDGNFYRVLSRVFADDFDISQSNAFTHFSHLAHKIMPLGKAGDFNQAMMDLGSEICKPKNPNCDICPLSEDCVAFQKKETKKYPIKSKKVKISEWSLEYFFVFHENQFLVQQRNSNFIWKKLFEFPVKIPKSFQSKVLNTQAISHKLTHKNLLITIKTVLIPSEKEFQNWAKKENLLTITFEKASEKSFPKPLENFLQTFENSR